MLVEEVLKSNRDVVEAESFWVWTIELLREAIHPDVVGPGAYTRPLLSST